MLSLFLACSLHWGVPPASQWRLGTVSAPVAEAGVDLSLQDALLDQLAERQALGDASAPPVFAEVLVADLVPTGRSAAGLLYEARLVVRFQAGAAQQNFSASRTIPDPGSAGAALPQRAEVFEDLAKVVAASGIAWVLSLPPG